MQKEDRALARSRLYISLLGAVCVGGLAVEDARAGGPPIAFDGYTVTDGEINADCPMTTDSVQAVCREGISDNGLLQREVIIPSGAHKGSYLQFILTDPGTTGDASSDYFSSSRGNLYFTNEDFVMQNHRADGLSSKQVILDSDFTDPDTEERFVNDITYNYGWAENASNLWVDAFQDISVLDYSSDPLNPVQTFTSSADIRIDGGAFDNFGNVVFKQEVDMATNDGPGIQKFQFDKKAGFANSSSGSVALDGETLSWAAFETVAAVWVGQLLDHAFSYNRFENRDTNASINGSSQMTAEALAWPSPPFSAVDTIASGMDTVSPTAAVAAPSALLATVAAGTGSSDTTVVSVPISYDGWTVSNGVFTLDACPGGVICGAPIINEQGLFQRVVRVGGVDYVHTIITTESATGDPENADFTAGSLGFKNENFIRLDSFVEGIASNLHIAQQDNSYQSVYPGQGGLEEPLPSTSGEFVYDVALKTGWAHGGPRDPIIAVDQSILVEDSNYLDTSSMYNEFSLKRGETQADTSMDMLTSVGTDSGSSGHEKPIMFASSVRAGAFQDTTHSLADPFLLPSVDGNIAWDSGDAIQATWIGGEYATADLNGSSLINTTSYTNLSTGDRTQSTISDGNTEMPDSLDPESWEDPPFGPSPTYQDPFVVP